MSITTTDVRVNDLVINKLNQEQYDSIAQVSDTEFYIIESNPNISYSEQAYSLPTASGSLEGTIYHYTGPDDSPLIHGHFYQCVASQTLPITYSWVELNVETNPTITFRTWGNNE